MEYNVHYGRRGTDLLYPLSYGGKKQVLSYCTRVLGLILLKTTGLSQ